MTTTAAPTTELAGPVPGDQSLPYGGFATRTIALAIDAVVVDGVALLVSVSVGLALNLLHVGKTATVVAAAVGGVAFVLWVLGYFVTFWTTTGQTPGCRVMGVRVLDDRTGRAPLRMRQALVRIVGCIVSTLMLCAGFLLILVDDRRRGLHDRMARTVVVYTSKEDDPGPGRRPAGRPS